MKIDKVPYISMILKEPNEFMSMQDFLIKMVTQRELHHNAFAYVNKEDGYVKSIFPIPSSRVELLEYQDELFVKFSFNSGKYITIPYEDCIHLRKDFNENDFFGDSSYKSLKNIMEVITYTDQSVVSAIKNSAVIRWILKFKSVLRAEDKELEMKKFVESYLSITNDTGAAATDPRYEIEQVKQDTFVPKAAQMKETIKRLYSYFGVNEKIVMNNYSEDEWNAFYESEIEPISMQLSNAFTRVFFTRKEKAKGNRIIFESSNLQYASMKTKLALVQMVDRGALTPNGWREILNLGPIEGGDKPIRRKDTGLVKEEDETNENKSNGKD